MEEEEEEGGEAKTKQKEKQEPIFVLCPPLLSKKEGRMWLNRLKGLIQLGGPMALPEALYVLGRLRATSQIKGRVIIQKFQLWLLS